jgi:hypothetical protein
VPFQCLGSPDQVGGAEKSAEPGSSEDSCPSNARTHLTKFEAQKGGLSRVAWRAPCPSDARARLTKLEAPSDPGGRLVRVVNH